MLAMPDLNGAAPLLRVAAIGYSAPANPPRPSAYQRYVAWDRVRYRQIPDAFAPEPIDELWSQLPGTVTSPYGAAWQDLPLDVVIDYTQSPVPANWLAKLRFGVWQFHFGDLHTICDDGSCFWEMYRRQPLTPSYLVATTQSHPHGRAIYESQSGTDFFSLAQSSNPIYWKAAAFPSRCLQRLRQHAETFWQDLSPALPVRHEPPAARTPGPGTLGAFYVRRLREATTTRLRNLRGTPPDPKWFCAYRRKSSPGQVVNADWQPLVPPPDRFYADPFVVRHAGKHYLLFEDFIESQQKGVISACEILPDGTTSRPQVVLETDYHLSYPFVFQAEGQMFMMPETEQNRTITVFRAKRFPYEWEFYRTNLENVRAVDATLLAHEGRYWIFCNIAAAGASSWDELHAFHAAGPFGPWTPHPGNPLVSDVRRARPAGAFFYRQGQLLRPAQDCSVCYGHAVVIHRVDRLTVDDYQESPVERIDPTWLAGNEGTHTWNENDAFEVIDGKIPARQLRRWAAGAASRQVDI